MAGVKRILRGPWLLIGLAGLGVIIALQYAVPNGGYKEVKTSTMVSHIIKGDIKEITFVEGDQEIRAVLTPTTGHKDGKKIMATWLDGQQTALIDTALKFERSGDIGSVNVKNPQPSLLGSLAATILP